MSGVTIFILNAEREILYRIDSSVERNRCELALPDGAHSIVYEVPGWQQFEGRGYGDVLPEIARR